MAKSVDPVETESFHPTVAEHARHLGIFCSPWKRTQGQPLGTFRKEKHGRFVATRLPRTLSVLLERELPLHVAVRLTATAVLTTLALVLHHPGGFRRLRASALRSSSWSSSRKKCGRAIGRAAVAVKHKQDHYGIATDGSCRSAIVTCFASHSTPNPISNPNPTNPPVRTPASTLTVNSMCEHGWLNASS